MLEGNIINQSQLLYKYICIVRGVSVRLRSGCDVRHYHVCPEVPFWLADILKLIWLTLRGPYFRDYFNNPSRAEIGTMVAILEIGAFISSLVVGRVGDIIGRRKTILYGSMIFFVGGALQTLATNMPMMMLGRIVAGLGVGSLSTIVPVYQSEISPPHNRGKLACIEFSGNIIGYTTSIWVDYFCGYIESNLSWRLPLLMQCVMGALLGLGSLVIVESPRQAIPFFPFRPFSVY